MTIDTAKNENGKPEIVYSFTELENHILRETMLRCLTQDITNLRTLISLMNKDVISEEEQIRVDGYRKALITMKTMHTKFLTGDQPNPLMREYLHLSTH